MRLFLVLFHRQSARVRLRTHQLADPIGRVTQTARQWFSMLRIDVFRSIWLASFDGIHSTRSIAPESHRMLIVGSLHFNLVRIQYILFFS